MVDVRYKRLDLVIREFVLSVAGCPGQQAGLIRKGKRHFRAHACKDKREIEIKEVVFWTGHCGGYR